MNISETANQRITDFETALSFDAVGRPGRALYTGVDLGTAYIVTAVVDEKGTPVAGALTRSESHIRDGLVLDYTGAIAILRRQVEALHAAGFPVCRAAAAYPPGTEGRNARAFGNVLEAAGLEVVAGIDEPTAAAKVLEIEDGAVVDIGGGTTGISVIKDGRVVSTADEPTGGTHVDLVLSGHFRIPTPMAEKIKRDPERQPYIFSIIKPVFEKMGRIVKQNLNGHTVKTLYLVGGTSCFPGIENVMAAETGLNVLLPRNPLLVTPLGIALYCMERMTQSS